MGINAYRCAKLDQIRTAGLRSTPRLCPTFGQSSRDHRLRDDVMFYAPRRGRCGGWCLQTRHRGRPRWRLRVARVHLVGQAGHAPASLLVAGDQANDRAFAPVTHAEPDLCVRTN